MREIKLRRMTTEKNSLSVPVQPAMSEPVPPVMSEQDFYAA